MKEFTQDKEVIRQSYMDSLSAKYERYKKWYTKYINSYFVGADGDLVRYDPDITFDDVTSAYTEWFKLYEEFDKWRKENANERVYKQRLFGEASTSSRS